MPAARRHAIHLLVGLAAFAVGTPVGVALARHAAGERVVAVVPVAAHSSAPGRWTVHRWVAHHRAAASHRAHPKAKPVRHPAHHAHRAHRHSAPRLPLWGVDVSWPQCRHGLPRTRAHLVTVGITGGRPRTGNPCLARQLRFAHRHGRVWSYLNVAAPHRGNAYAYGRRIARDALRRLRRAGRVTPTVWLDVETGNHWSRHPRTNRRTIRGVMHELRRHGVHVGVYSTRLMWRHITGGMAVHVPVWVATGGHSELRQACRTGFGGRPALMAQYVGHRHHHEIDIDTVCARHWPRR